MKLLPPAALVCAIASSASAQTLVRTVIGATGTHFGAAVVPCGDRNGDGYEDVLVGAPAYNSGKGIVYCISGYVLAHGNTTNATLWSVEAGSAQGAGYAFGTSIAMLPDMNGDGVTDFAVGAPGIDYAPSGTDSGAIYLINGASHFQHSVIWGNGAGQRFGSCMSAVGDVTGDGKFELAVGAPGLYGFVAGSVSILDGAGLVSSVFSNTIASQISVGSSSGEAGFGTSVASGFDFDGDGVNDVAVGSPFGLGMTALDSGAIKIIHALTPGGAPVSYFAAYRTWVAGEHLGFSLDARDDYDGDGVVDLVAGAPDSPSPGGQPNGRAVVLSGARFHAGDPTPELYVLNPAASGAHYGYAVRACGDLNGDGVGDIMVGAPDYNALPLGIDKGFVWMHSGATGMLMASLVGAAHEHLGDALGGLLDDYDGDGFPEFVIGGSLGDAPTTDCGTIKCYRLFPSPPSTYCTAKVNSLGCTPYMSFNGAPSLTSPTPFNLFAFQVLNQRNGVLFYSDRPNGSPFQGGVLCVKPPTRRTPSQNSGGSPSGSDCTGVFTLDFNAYLQSGADSSLSAGTEVFCQYWSRDSGSASTTNLSNAMRFLIAP